MLTELRRRYSRAMKGLTYDNASRTEVEVALGRALRAIEEPTPEDWLAAIEGLQLLCRRCAGTGQFVTRVENGRPVGPGADCYRCGGKGVQTYEDGLRNRWYDLNRSAEP